MKFEKVDFHLKCHLLSLKRKHKFLYIFYTLKFFISLYIFNSFMYQFGHCNFSVYVTWCLAGCVINTLKKLVVIKAQKIKCTAMK